MDPSTTSSSSDRPTPPPDVQPDDLNDRSPGARRPRSTRGWMWRGAKLVVSAPFAAFPVEQIVRNGRLVADLVSDFRRGPKPPQTVPQQFSGKLDRTATALVLGLSEHELDQHLALRRRHTAKMAYLAFGLGWVFVGAWLVRLLDMGWTGQRLLAALQFAPFCLVFFLTAFKQAHVNWQLRTGVLGSAGDYLRSAAPFWPH